jgi:hypothetical protein
MNAWMRGHGAVAAATLLGVTLALAPAAQSRAASGQAEVEALQMPAWVTREGQRTPLAPGAQIKSGDSITTGAGSRVVLRLAEGSIVKLGENARFELSALAQKREGAQEQFSAKLGVQQGAFRFTTTPDSKFRGTRAIDIQFATVTASVVGTDLWGKSTGDGDVVALIEGKITTTRPGEPPVTMDQPKTIYVAPRNAARPPVSAITLAQLNAYAQETELQAGAGAAGKGGTWKVYAGRSTNKDELQAVYERLIDAGYAAAITPSVSQGKQIFQVRIAGLLSEADGVAIAVKLRVELGLQDVRVSL